MRVSIGAMYNNNTLKKLNLTRKKDIKRVSNSTILPGQTLEILIYNGQMHFVPVEPIGSLYGLFKDAEIPYERDEQDRSL